MNNSEVSSSSSSYSRANAIPDEDYENDINNNVDMHRNSRLDIAENRSFSPVNTNAAYSTMQKEYKHWCREIKKFNDGIIVTDEMLCFFLANFVMARGNKFKKNEDGTPFPLGRRRINSCLC